MQLLWGQAFFAGALAQLVARLTSLFAIQLQDAGIAGAGALKGLVFLTICSPWAFRASAPPPWPRAWGSRSR